MDWTPHAVFVLGLLVISLVVLATSWLRYDVVAALIIIALSASGTLSVQQALAGFSNPALILIAAMFIVGRAVMQTGLADLGARRLVTFAARSETRLILAMSAGAALLSSILNNTTVIAIFIPISITTANRLGVPPNRILMPLAFAALLGGMCSLIGTSTNLAINGVLESAHVPSFDLFEFSVIGLILTTIGILYMTFVGRRQLHRSGEAMSLTDRYHVRRFLTEILVQPDSDLVGKPVSVDSLEGRYGIHVLGIVRAEGNAVLAPTPYNYVRKGDTMILQGEPQDLLRFQNETGLAPVPNVKVGDVDLRSSDVQVMEAIVPTNSPMLGQPLHRTPLKESYNTNVLAVWRDHESYSHGFRNLRLAAGDVILLQAHERDLERLRRDQLLIFVGTLRQPPSISPKSWITVFVILVGVILATIKIVPISIVAIAMAVTMVLARCVDPDEIYESIDWKIILLTAGLLPLGEAFREHGLAKAVADGLLSIAHGGDSLLCLASLFGATVLLTQTMTNLAAGVLLAPVALGIAEQLHLPPHPFVLAVLFGASTSFITPFGHPVNLMVMGPADYRFRDFVRVGLGLTVVVGLAAIFLLWAVFLRPI